MMVEVASQHQKMDGGGQRTEEMKQQTNKIQTLKRDEIAVETVSGEK